MQIGEFSDSDRNNLVNTVASWLQSTDLPANVSIRRVSGDETFYEVSYSSGQAAVSDTEFCAPANCPAQPQGVY
jgi:hypothetical protein